MRILVTGGAGYIGSVLVPKLLDVGHRVTVVDNFMYRQSHALAACCSNTHFAVIKADARDMRVMEPLIRYHDVLLPLAAIVGASACDADTMAAHSTNYWALSELVNHASHEQVIVAPISNSGYGVGSDKECDENSPLNPVSLYGRLKVNAEKVVLAHSNGFSLRLATVFGMSPRMRRDLLVNDFVWRAMTDKAVTLFEPHFRRNYIHVQDVAQAFLYVIDHAATDNNNTFVRNTRDGERFKISFGGDMKPGVYNVGLSNANLSKLQLCEHIKKHVHDFVFMEAPIGEDVDKRNYIVSNAKIEATGFRPEYSLDMGIIELIKGYQMMRKEYSNV